jgi:hypothetical protein
MSEGKVVRNYLGLTCCIHRDFTEVGGTANLGDRDFVFDVVVQLS